MYCNNCGEQINDQATICPRCGVAQQPNVPPTNMYSQPSNVPPNGSTYTQPGAVPPPNNAYTQNNGYTQPNPNGYTQPNNMYPPNNGYSQPGNMYPPNYNPYPPQMSPTVYDSGSFGWGVLGFFLPLVGLILFLVWKNTKPLSASKAGWGALIGFILVVIGQFF